MTQRVWWQCKIKEKQKNFSFFVDLIFNIWYIIYVVRNTTRKKEVQMHNMVYLIGRLNNELVMKGDTVEIELAVQRAFKNDDGIYETDFIPVKLSGQIALNTIEYVKKGDLVGIKGRIEMNDTLKVVCDKISFLASKRED